MPPFSPGSENDRHLNVPVNQIMLTKEMRVCPFFEMFAGTAFVASATS
jgi:hypothetical protein